MPKSISDGGGPSDGQRVGPLLVGVERDGPPILSLPPRHARRPGLVSRTGVAGNMYWVVLETSVKKIPPGRAHR